MIIIKHIVWNRLKYCGWMHQSERALVESNLNSMDAYMHIYKPNLLIYLFPSCLASFFFIRLYCFDFLLPMVDNGIHRHPGSLACLPQTLAVHCSPLSIYRWLICLNFFLWTYQQPSSIVVVMGGWWSESDRSLGPHFHPLA